METKFKYFKVDGLNETNIKAYFVILILVMLPFFFKYVSLNVFLLTCLISTQCVRINAKLEVFLSVLGLLQTLINKTNLMNDSNRNDELLLDLILNL